MRMCERRLLRELKPRWQMTQRMRPRLVEVEVEDDEEDEEDEEEQEEEEPSQERVVGVPIPDQQLLVRRDGLRGDQNEEDEEQEEEHHEEEEQEEEEQQEVSSVNEDNRDIAARFTLAPDDRVRAPGPGPPDSTELFRTKFTENRNEFYGLREHLGGEGGLGALARCGAVVLVLLQVLQVVQVVLLAQHRPYRKLCRMSDVMMSARLSGGCGLKPDFRPRDGPGSTEPMTEAGDGGPGAEGPETKGTGRRRTGGTGGPGEEREEEKQEKEEKEEKEEKDSSPGEAHFKSQKKKESSRGFFFFFK
ncbi:hypothetical protein EYF80_031983 [Liparis tanakae]|uniref:Uncharacterized protein n=1 Tax=Liparis tanakae TaxID=230148 RepID=A0A4Z2GWG9_9TELE|nr:hypothetical protein EYF80_031983 [Liparis tanakae]